MTIDVLHAACAQVGLDASSVEPIRFGENDIYRLPGQVIARIARAGQFAAAVNEVNVSRWLEDSGSLPHGQSGTSLNQFRSLNVP